MGGFISGNGSVEGFASLNCFRSLASILDKLVLILRVEHTLTKAHAENRLDEKLKVYTTPRLLLIDEIG